MDALRAVEIYFSGDYPEEEKEFYQDFFRCDYCRKDIDIDDYDSELHNRTMEKLPGNIFCCEKCALEALEEDSQSSQSDWKRLGMCYSYFS